MIQAPSAGEPPNLTAYRVLQAPSQFLWVREVQEGAGVPPLIKTRPTVLTDGHHTTLTSPHIGLDCTSGDWWRGSLSQGRGGVAGNSGLAPKHGKSWFILTIPVTNSLMVQ